MVVDRIYVDVTNILPEYFQQQENSNKIKDIYMYITYKIQVYIDMCQLTLFGYPD